MAEMMEEVMDVVYEHLSPAEIDAHHNEIMYLPEVLVSRDEIEILEGVAVDHTFGDTTLIISTNLRIVQIGIGIRDKKAKVWWDVLYSEIETVIYDNDLRGHLKIRKKKGWLKTSHFQLRSEHSGDPSEFLICLRRHIPNFVDESPLAEPSNESELADDTMTSDDAVASDKAVAIARALRSLSTVEAESLSRGEIKELPNILWEDELPEAIISGTYHKGNGILVATDRRLIFVDKGVVGLTVEDLYFEDISSIETHQGWVLGSINIYARGNKERIDNISKEMVPQFADFLRNKLAVAKQLKQEQQSSPLIVQSDVSVADELRKFAELRDLGIITDEEFEAQKAKLLGM